jgi:hypothetical protein
VPQLHGPAKVRQQAVEKVRFGGVERLGPVGPVEAHRHDPRGSKLDDRAQAMS